METQKTLSVLQGLRNLAQISRNGGKSEVIGQCCLETCAMGTALALC